MRQGPRVLLYENITEFLRDFYTEKKRHNSRWSYRVWARQIGIKSPSTLAMIVAGTRLPSENVKRALTRFLGLSASELAHFHRLVHVHRLKRLIERYEARVDSPLVPARPKG